MGFAPAGAMVRTTSFILASLLGLTACKSHVCVEEHDNQIRPLEEDGSGSLELSTWELDFGTVPLGELATRAATLSNVGDGSLTIESIELTPSDTTFYLDQLSDGSLEPGGSADLVVGFEPLAVGVESGWLSLRSDDPEVWTHSIFLTGAGSGASLEIDPAAIDIDDALPGCETEHEITLRNGGDQPLTLLAVDWEADSEELWVDHLPASGLVLEPGGQHRLRVHHLSVDEGGDLGQILMSSDDPMEPERAVGITVHTPEAITWSESFTWEGAQGADVILAVDRSASMMSKLEVVLDELVGVTQQLVVLGVDFQLALAVADDGCIAGSELFVHPGHSEDEARALLTEMLEGEYGSCGERAFMLLEAALHETDPGECNGGLLREGTGLNLVGVSDEPEQSVNTWPYYLTSFQSCMDHPDDVVIHGVGGDYPGGCDGADLHASAYTGIYEATVATGGTLVSICSAGWGAELAEHIGTHVGGTARLELSHEPVPESLEVWVDGVEWEEGWSLTGHTTLTFDDDHRPSDGAEIEVSYTVAIECE